MSHRFDWNDTAVLPPTAELVTDATPGGLNIGDADRPSIHSATGSKCAELGNVPATPDLQRPDGTRGRRAGQGGAEVEVVDATVPVVPAPVPVKLVMARPDGIRWPSWFTTAAQSTVVEEMWITSVLATRSSLAIDTTLSKVGIWALSRATSALRSVTPVWALRTSRKRHALAPTRASATTAGGGERLAGHHALEGTLGDFRAVRG